MHDWKAVTTLYLMESSFQLECNTFLKNLRNEEEPMPYAIVIHAFPRTDLPLVHAQGKILHGLFYELLQNASAAKGDEVHSTEGLKPFSTAPLLSERQRRAESIRTGEELKIRFTF